MCNHRLMKKSMMHQMTGNVSFSAVYMSMLLNNGSTKQNNWRTKGLMRADRVTGREKL